MYHRRTYHYKLRRCYKPPDRCESCGEIRTLDLANIKNHVYTLDIEDYMWLCIFCHRKMDMTEEKKQKISATLKGHNVSEKTKRKISESLKGRKLSEEHKRNISKGMLKKWGNDGF